MNPVDTAVNYFKEGYSCSQAVLAAFSEPLGLNRDLAVRVACGFGGGLGRMAGTCGAATGACLVLGLKYGSTIAADKAAKDHTYALVRTFFTRFQARHGSVTCRELLGYDISTPEGLEQARTRQVFSHACPNYVQSAAEILQDLLRENP